MNKRRKEPIFKRPNHVDFMTTEEHKKNKTTGVRKNDMTMEFEFWVLGEIRKKVHFLTLKNNPKALEEAHMEVFFF